MSIYSKIMLARRSLPSLKTRISVDGVKKFALALSLLMCASCGKIEARSVGSVVGNGAKTVVGAGLTYLGASMVVNSASPKLRKQMIQEFKNARAELRVEMEKRGVNLAQFDAETAEILKVITIVPVISGFIGAGITFGGLWLTYKGLMGLFSSPAVEQV